MRNIKQNNKGFTLTEVLISIAMVGILFLPLLSVFTKSMNINNKAKNIQRSYEVASSVAEQVRGYSSFSEMCNYANASNNDLELTKSEDGKYEFKLSNLKNDGMNYTADIIVDYNMFSNINTKGLPEITSLGAGSTVMACENLNCTDQVIAAYQAKYYEDTGRTKTISDTLVAKALNKTVEIEITDTEINAKNENILPEGTVHVKIYTKYTIDSSRTSDSTLASYASEAAMRSDVLYSENVVLEKLKGIYIFFMYDIANSVDIFQGINFSMNLQQNYSKNYLKNFTLYSLCQGIDDVLNSSGTMVDDKMDDYAATHGCKSIIKRSGTVPKGYVKDYVSVFSNFPAEIDGDSTSKEDINNIVSNTPIDRLAKVHITVYKDGTECATLDTTRGE